MENAGYINEAGTGYNFHQNSGQNSKSSKEFKAQGQVITTSAGYEDEPPKHIDEDSASLERDDEKPYSTQGRLDKMQSTNQGFYRNQSSSTKRLYNRTGYKNRYATAKNQTRSNKTGNPYISDMYKESELLVASNAYHRLDKSQNFMGNKAFAQTIINDLKQKQRQNEFETKLGLKQDHDVAQEQQIIQKKASREVFQKAQEEIYNSTKKSSSSQAGQLLSRTNTLYGSQAEIQNLKEVLQGQTIQRTRLAGNTALTSMKNENSPKKGCSSQMTLGYELPEDAAQRWMSNAQIQAS